MTIRRLLLAATAPLPPVDDIGLMTLDVFLRKRNKQGKSHPSGAYDINIMKMNETLYSVAREKVNNREFVISKDLGGDDNGLVFEHEGKVVAVLHGGVMYHDSLLRPRELPTSYYRHGRDGHTQLAIERYKQVKYASEYVTLVSDRAAKNRRNFPFLLQNVVHGEPLQVRSAGPPQKNKGTSLAVLNSRWEIVADALDEWNCTLIRTAEEYRGRGLGTMLGQHWYEHNPDFDSGGFTPGGRNNAQRMWEVRVREFLANGWYSEFVRKGVITRQQVAEITKDLRGRVPRPRAAPQPVKPDIRVFTDEDIGFVVYDSRFLEDPSEDYVHGFGFFRDAPRIGTFLYTIDYDRKYAKLTTAVALQMARDNNHPLYVGPEYTDLVEWEQVQHVQKEGDYISLTQDVLPLKQLSRLEQAHRRAVDRYEEKKNLLLEIANSKWA